MACRAALERLLAPRLDFECIRLRRLASINDSPFSLVLSIHTWFASQFNNGCDKLFPSLSGGILLSYAEAQGTKRAGFF